MSDNYIDGVAFTTRKIEEINIYMASHLSPRLFFAAYYAPKAHQCSNDEGLFWCAVTNIYGLFFDCMPNIKKLLNMLNNKGSLNDQKMDYVEEYVKKINALRYVYCHNVNADVFSKNRKILTDVHDFFKMDQDEFFFSIPQLQSNKWGSYIRNICSGVDECVNYIYAALQCAVASDNMTKSLIITNYEQILADWLNRDKFLFDVMRDELIMSQNKLHLGRQREITNKIVNYELKRLKESAKKLGHSIDSDLYLKVIKEIDKPALPYIITKKLIDFIQRGGTEAENGS
ncbi:MAG: hypothetical protein FWF87_02260 [Synergistaceae bacterium]|nr:hypothetical protein [Synergistaceae bacterium]